MNNAFKFLLTLIAAALALSALVVRVYVHWWFNPGLTEMELIQAHWPIILFWFASLFPVVMGIERWQ